MSVTDQLKRWRRGRAAEKWIHVLHSGAKPHEPAGIMRTIIVILLSLSMTLPRALPALAQEFRKWEAKIAEYKQWLDSLGPKGVLFWVRLDARHRPHRLYLGEGFFRADARTQEQFVETYSSYLAGHPEKSMLIDLFDAATNNPVGEYGWGGFKLYSQSVRSSERARK
ncbi:MAG: hypothetical protein A2038_08475 [Deltaproteobacteria bacterium GWA2_57_13]|nr:MAG: hypothetical protein A2038_08475 [Deltaproteobacteria bacterium GWA2_57_13]OGQ50639.1 MAG: hypothetical protein A3I10_02230 [Deltaproteobacteria bacterium RIFCSPLOWO2_02_FULL_57_26]OGQ77714.1 MAG: hypothetical protein A3G40_11625 [Deltaproteobacteria bacterium RIFCSPLOWO2_12_FULL_57_22]